MNDKQCQILQEIKGDILESCLKAEYHFGPESDKELQKFAVFMQVPQEGENVMSVNVEELKELITDEYTKRDLRFPVKYLRDDLKDDDIDLDNVVSTIENIRRFDDNGMYVKPNMGDFHEGSRGFIFDSFSAVEQRDSDNLHKEDVTTGRTFSINLSYTFDAKCPESFVEIMRSILGDYSTPNKGCSKFRDTVNKYLCRAFGLYEDAHMPLKVIVFESITDDFDHGQHNPEIELKFRFEFCEGLFDSEVYHAIMYMIAALFLQFGFKAALETVNSLIPKSMRTDLHVISYPQLVFLNFIENSGIMDEWASWENVLRVMLRIVPGKHFHLTRLVDAWTSIQQRLNKTQHTILRNLKYRIACAVLSSSATYDSPFLDLDKMEADLKTMIGTLQILEDSDIFNAEPLPKSIMDIWNYNFERNENGALEHIVPIVPFVSSFSDDVEKLNYIQFLIDRRADKYFKKS